MPSGYIFWGLMICWVIFGIWVGYHEVTAGRYVTSGGSLLLFALLFLLGRKVFGEVIQG